MALSHSMSMGDLVLAGWPYVTLHVSECTQMAGGVSGVGCSPLSGIMA